MVRDLFSLVADLGDLEISGGSGDNWNLIREGKNGFLMVQYCGLKKIYYGGYQILVERVFERDLSCDGRPIRAKIDRKYSDHVLKLKF